MDWLTFFAKLVEFLAWPIITLMIVLLLRAQITASLPALKRLKAGPVEAEFERQVEQIKNEAPLQLALPDNVAPPLDAARNQLLQLAALNPRAAIVEAWRGLESSAKRAALQQSPGSPMPDVSTAVKTINSLARERILTPEEVALFHDLRGLRNQAMHVPDFSPTYEAAVNYIELALQLQTRFEQLANPGN
jgi:hypothetical protein